MQAHFPEQQGLEVQVDDVIYMPSLDSPEDRPHPFVYFITIHNRGAVPVTIRGRKWVISQNNGEKIVVEGAGVVGQSPHLPPGENFNYNSYHVVSDDSVVEGAFFGETASGDVVHTRIPQFSLQIPQWA